jgi:vacuolar-type H+-ATPase subunit H
MRKKELEALAAKQGEELAKAKAKIAEYEKQLEEYRLREESIVEALTTASETKKRVLEQAEKELGHAQSQAQKAIENAKNEANAIIAAAKEKAERLIAQAQKRCEELEKEALAKIKEQNALHNEMSASLASMAQKLHSYIERFQPKFAGADKKPASKTIEFPEEYESPAELYHYIMKLKEESDESDESEEAEEAANTAEQEPKAPKFVTVTENLLSQEEIDEAILVPATLGDKPEETEQASESKAEASEAASSEADAEAESEKAEATSNTEEASQPLSDFEAELEKVREAVLAVLEE